MSELNLACTTIVQQKDKTTAILHSEDRGVAMHLVNPPMKLEPGKTYTVQFAEVQEG